MGASGPAVRRRAATVGLALAALVLAGCSPSPAAGGARPSTSAAATASTAPVRSSASPAAARSSHTGPTALDSTRPQVPASPCATNRAAQLVQVSVRRQHVWMCAGHDLRYDSPVTTGAVGLPYDSTPVGTFHIQAKDTHTVLTLVGGAQYTVRYWIPFDAPLFGFHDAAWQTMPFGSQRYRTRGSHGCVHMPLAAMRFLYHWARVGATVRVRR